MTPKQEEALRDYLQEAIVPLIEQVLVKKLGQAMTFAAEQLVQPKREWVGLTDEEANQLWESIDSDWELMKRTETKLKEKNT
jgi:hypothetical protein